MTHTEINQLLEQELTDNELSNLLFHFKVNNNLKKVKMKTNLREIMENKNQDEYSDNDNDFFNKWSSSECLVYKYSDEDDDEDWFILDDDNYPIFKECFVVIK